MRVQRLLVRSSVPVGPEGSTTPGGRGRVRSGRRPPGRRPPRGPRTARVPGRGTPRPRGRPPAAPGSRTGQAHEVGHVHPPAPGEDGDADVPAGGVEARRQLPGDVEVAVASGVAGAVPFQQGLVGVEERAEGVIAVVLHDGEQTPARQRPGAGRDEPGPVQPRVGLRGHDELHGFGEPLQERFGRSDRPPHVRELLAAAVHPVLGHVDGEVARSLPQGRTQPLQRDPGARPRVHDRHLGEVRKFVDDGPEEFPRVARPVPVIDLTEALDPLFRRHAHAPSEMSGEAPRAEQTGEYHGPHPVISGYAKNRTGRRISMPPQYPRNAPNSPEHRRFGGGIRTGRTESPSVRRLFRIWPNPDRNPRHNDEDADGSGHEKTRNRQAERGEAKPRRNGPAQLRKPPGGKVSQRTVTRPGTHG